MKESRFIELLNLYVDQELPAPDAAELEQEIARSPARRRTYEQYCRMHRACVMLFENERAPAPHLRRLNEAAREAAEKVVAFPGLVPAAGDVAAERSRSWMSPSWAAAGMVAAAACVAFVVMRQSPNAGMADATTSIATQVATVEPATIAGTSEEPVAIPQTVTSPRSNYRSVVVANALLRNHDAAPESGGFAFASDATAYEWMNRVQLSPLQRVSADELVFEARSLQTPESRTYRGRNPYAADAEMTAFQFQR